MMMSLIMMMNFCVLRFTENSRARVKANIQNVTKHTIVFCLRRNLVQNESALPPLRGFGHCQSVKGTFDRTGIKRQLSERKTPIQYFSCFYLTKTFLVGYFWKAANQLSKCQRHFRPNWGEKAIKTETPIK